MQLRAFLCLSFLSFVFSVAAQNYTGVWEGHFYLRGKKNKMNVRIELTQKGNRLQGFVSTRGFQKNTVYGCDYIVTGWVKDNVMVLERNNVQRGIAMTKADCGSFRRIELYPPDHDSVSMAKTRWYWMDESKETFVVKKTGSVISETAKEEMASIKKPEISIFKVKEVDSGIYSMYQTYPGLRWVENKEMTICVTSVGEKPKSTITVMLNGGVIADDFNLSEKVLVLRLKDVSKFNVLEFINNSNKRFKLDVKISFQQGNEKAEWNVSIPPGMYEVLRLNRKD